MRTYSRSYVIGRSYFFNYSCGTIENNWPPYAENPVRRLRLRPDSKGWCGCPFYSPDGFKIRRSRVPWTLRTLKLLLLLLHPQDIHFSMIISLVLFLSLVLALLMLIPFSLKIGLIRSICFPKASGLIGNVICALLAV